MSETYLIQSFVWISNGTCRCGRLTFKRATGLVTQSQAVETPTATYLMMFDGSLNGESHGSAEEHFFLGPVIPDKPFYSGKLGDIRCNQSHFMAHRLPGD